MPQGYLGSRPPDSNKISNILPLRLNVRKFIHKLILDSSWHGSYLLNYESISNKGNVMDNYQQIITKYKLNTFLETRRKRRNHKTYVH